MTEYELADVVSSVATVATDAAAVYLSLVSAFLIVAYMFGPKLTRSQVIIISVLFVCGAGFFAFATTTTMLRLAYFIGRLAEAQTDTTLYMKRELGIFVGSAQMLGILASLRFMWDVRRKEGI